MLSMPPDMRFLPSINISRDPANTMAENLPVYELNSSNLREVLAQEEEPDSTSVRAEMPV